MSVSPQDVHFLPSDFGAALLFYLFGVAASGTWLDQTLLGCVVLTLLRLIPWFPN